MLATLAAAGDGDDLPAAGCNRSVIPVAVAGLDLEAGRTEENVESGRVKEAQGSARVAEDGAVALGGGPGKGDQFTLHGLDLMPQAKRPAAGAGEAGRPG